jgi:hypothetical protein
MVTRKAKFAGTLGLGVVLASSGCGSLMHRSTVPPAPKSPRLGNNQVGFGSEPNPAQTGQLRPTGPIPNTASPYGNKGTYGKGSGDSEMGSAPLGDAPPLGGNPGPQNPPAGAF